MNSLNLGSIVKCREREWVVLPSSDKELFLLRPLTGGDDEICGVYRPFSSLGLDRIEPAHFPIPSPEEDTGDAVGIKLLSNAARLTLRDGAGPFRSLGRVSFRPRAYQFVPMLMALRLDPVRLLIADDVGVGKTIEGLLIARELLDRGEIQRICVLSPPYLCNQWKIEMQEKFHIDPVVIGSGTVRQLEKKLPAGDQSVFGYFPYIIVSIDYAKSDRHRANFLQHCPKFVLVDEVHGAAKPSSRAHTQQQRHKLLCDLASNPDRHFVLLTATPHSGFEESFLSLLGLLKSEFAELDLNNMQEDERIELARHFIQRRRGDVARWLGEETPFPKRDNEEISYILSSSYHELFDRVYKFSRELVQKGEKLTGWKKRIRFWAALSLLRCIMSSPAAAVASLSARIQRLKDKQIEDELTDENYAPYIYESTDKDTIDTQPAHIIKESETDFNQSERRRLRGFTKLAKKLMGTDEDKKIVKCVETISRLLNQGYQPIIWCRYIATSDYVASQIESRLKSNFSDLRVISITGALSEDERLMRVEELSEHSHRVLVATDCLSEGINLQEHFTAVLHYDLPWNPNRLEQREGRVDRFGQPAKEVKAVLFYGTDNPIDGAVLDVLLRKAKEIYRTLGVSVPVPTDSETVMEAVLKALFSRAKKPQQLRLFDVDEVKNVHDQWDRTAEREKESRTRFAQRTIKPGEVERELKETDSVLGDPNSVESFVLNACQRLNVTVENQKDGTFTIVNPKELPEQIKSSVTQLEDWDVIFTVPAPEGVTYLGRNHPFVAALAQYLLESALSRDGTKGVSRCGVIRTESVNRRTTLMLLRLRFLLKKPDKSPLLAEETFIAGFQGFPPDRLEWLSDERGCLNGTLALDLIQKARPESNISDSFQKENLEEILSWWDELQEELEELINRRAEKLDSAHRRVRASARLKRRGLKIQPQLPPDLLGILVLLPVPLGVRR